MVVADVVNCCKWRPRKSTAAYNDAPPSNKARPMRQRRRWLIPSACQWTSTWNFMFPNCRSPSEIVVRWRLFRQFLGTRNYSAVLRQQVGWFENKISIQRYITRYTGKRKAANSFVHSSIHSFVRQATWPIKRNNRQTYNKHRHGRLTDKSRRNWVQNNSSTRTNTQSHTVLTWIDICDDDDDVRPS